jgi:hypothetical protein
LKTINPKRDISVEIIGLCEYLISECKIFIVIITSNYYSNTLANLFTRRALYYSELNKKHIVALMDYEPSIVSHTRYMSKLIN